MPTDNDSIIHTVALPETLDLKLRSAAKFQGKSMPDLLADAIVARIEDDGIRTLPEMPLDYDRLVFHDVRLSRAMSDRFSGIVAKMGIGSNKVVINVAYDMTTRPGQQEAPGKFLGRGQ